MRCYSAALCHRPVHSDCARGSDDMRSWRRHPGHPVNSASNGARDSSCEMEPQPRAWGAISQLLMIGIDDWRERSRWRCAGPDLKEAPFLNTVCLAYQNERLAPVGSLLLARGSVGSQSCAAYQQLIRHPRDPRSGPPELAPAKAGGRPSGEGSSARPGPRVRPEFTLGPRRARTRGAGPRTGSGRGQATEIRSLNSRLRGNDEMRF